MQSFYRRFCQRTLYFVLIFNIALYIWQLLLLEICMAKYKQTGGWCGAKNINE